jgi:hypothetical protein
MPSASREDRHKWDLGIGEVSHILPDTVLVVEINESCMNHLHRFTFQVLASGIRKKQFLQNSTMGLEWQYESFSC